MADWVDAIAEFFVGKSETEKKKEKLPECGTDPGSAAVQGVNTINRGLDQLKGVDPMAKRYKAEDVDASGSLGFTTPKCIPRVPQSSISIKDID